MTIRKTKINILRIKDIKPFVLTSLGQNKNKFLLCSSLVKINRIYIFSVLCVSAIFAIALYINFINQNISENFLRERLTLELNAVNQNYQNLESVYIKKLSAVTEETSQELGFVKARNAKFVALESRLVRGNSESR